MAIVSFELFNPDVEAAPKYIAVNTWHIHVVLHEMPNRTEIRMLNNSYTVKGTYFDVLNKIRGLNIHSEDGM